MTAGSFNTEASYWSDYLKWLFNHTNGPSVITEVRFTSEAQTLFNEIERETKESLRAVREIHGGFASHLSKHPGMIAEVALTYHFLTPEAYNSNPGLIGVETLRKAIGYMESVKRHAYYLYSCVLSSSPPYELAVKLARSIAASKEALEKIGRNWMIQHCSDFKNADDRVRVEAVQFLTDANWINAGEKQYGGWPKSYMVNPRVFGLFAAEGEVWRKKREVVRGLIGDQGLESD